MKLLLLAFLSVLIITGIANAFMIGLSVSKIFTIEIKNFHYNDTFNTKWFEAEIMNSGSLQESVQMRIIANDENGTIFIGWSDRKNLPPGSNTVFRIYWNPKTTGNYNVIGRVYYGGEAAEENISIIIANLSKTQSDEYKIDKLRCLGNYILLTLTSSKDMSDIVIIPEDFEYGWAMGQAHISELKANTPRQVLLPFKSPGNPGYPTLEISSIYEKNYTSKKIYLQRDTGFFALLYEMISSLATRF